MKNIGGVFCYKTDIGKVRMTNEDQAYALTNSKGRILLLVCDGMGGENRGDLASTLAKDIITSEFKNSMRTINRTTDRFWLRSAIKKANNEIFTESFKNPLYKGMGTTLSAVLIGENYLIVAQIGDSRVYTLKDKKLIQLTEDQTYVDYLYKSGQISEEEKLVHPKRHVLLNALGIYPTVNVDIKTVEYNKEPLLLCSDGLYNNIGASDIEAIIRLDEAPEQKVESLISIANANGGSDNMAVVYWEVNE
jgi:protein phosphatase